MMAINDGKRKSFQTSGADLSMLATITSLSLA